MAVIAQTLTVDEFDRLVLLPEHADRRLELVRGEIIEVVSNNYSSQVAARLLMEMGLHVKQTSSGYITGADGGYEVGGERYIPDVAYVSRERQAAPSRAAYNPVPPDLAVEVLSPTDDRDALRLKVANFLAAGAVVWVVDPDAQTVEIYAPGQPVRVLRRDDALDGGTVLPGFAVPVADIFPPDPDADPGTKPDDHAGGDTSAE